MKRDPALIPFSHDHQHALARALRLRRASDMDPRFRAAAIADFLEFAESRLEPHFVDEEAIVDRALSACEGADAVAAARRELLRQHAELRARFGALRVELEAGEAISPERMHEAGALLTAHVRFEERTLFELLQRELGANLATIVAH